MNIWKKLLSISTITTSLLAFGGAAVAQEAPDELVKRVSAEVIAAAKSDDKIQGGDRQRSVQLVEEKILPHADFERATMLVMGQHWRRATPEQQKQLIEEFRKLLIYTYAGAMVQVRDQRINVKPLRADPADTDVVVNSEFQKGRGAEPVQVSYRLAKSPEGWKIYDVNVMGVWLGLTYKDSFDAEINKGGGIDGLIKTLVEKNKRARSDTGIVAPPSEQGTK
jgi:phospholipid transport system substrate-binding protein